MNNINNIKSTNKFKEDRNIRNMQDIEYEKSLILDKKKDEHKSNFKIHKNDKKSNEESDEESDEESYEESDEESDRKSNDEFDGKSENTTYINNVNLIKKENNILSVKEMRDARLAFFSKK